MGRRIMNCILTGTCLAFLMNCQSSLNNFQDPTFKPYISEFTRISKLAGRNLDAEVSNIGVIFGDVTDKNYAWYDPFRNEIVVNKESWQTLKFNAEKEELLFHEFGHATLNRDHSDGTIMQARGMLGQVYYTTNYNILINDLFCKKIPCLDIQYDYRKYPQPKENKVPNEVKEASDKKITTAEILNNEHAVVRFTATWCPPCKALAPVFDEVAAAHPDVKVYIVDVDQYKDIAGDLNVRGIPTCMAIRNNKVSETIVGNQPKPELEKLFK